MLLSRQYPGKILLLLIIVIIVIVKIVITVIVKLVIGNKGLTGLWLLAFGFWLCLCTALHWAKPKLQRLSCCRSGCISA